MKFVPRIALAATAVIVCLGLPGCTSGQLSPAKIAISTPTAPSGPWDGGVTKKAPSPAPYTSPPVSTATPTSASTDSPSHVPTELPATIRAKDADAAASCEGVPADIATSYSQSKVDCEELKLLRERLEKESDNKTNGNADSNDLLRQYHQKYCTQSGDDQKTVRPLNDGTPQTIAPVLKRSDVSSGGSGAIEDGVKRYKYVPCRVPQEPSK